uniref:Uncharacterized protein n=1 Tax=Tanacetum cinerariifolium TaxID=118510 RepID=A0A6L2MHA8_TANCI|nr:hypothetical protein [Tanacetum cinerariifolium]
MSLLINCGDSIFNLRNGLWLWTSLLMNCGWISFELMEVGCMQIPYKFDIRHKLTPFGWKTVQEFGIDLEFLQRHLIDVYVVDDLSKLQESYNGLSNIGGRLSAPDSIMYSTREHVFKKKSLIAMGIVMDLDRGTCCLPTTRRIRKDDEVEEAANEDAGGPAKV